jgi:galactofuranose transport system substrate-binding protein
MKKPNLFRFFTIVALAIILFTACPAPETGPITFTVNLELTDPNGIIMDSWTAEFSQDSTEATITCPYAVSPIQIKGSGEDFSGDIQINGSSIVTDQGETVDLEVGTNTITLIVITETGEEQECTLTVTRSEQITVGFSIAQTSDDWHQNISQSIQTTATERLHSLTFHDGDSNQTLQSDALNGFITAGVDVIGLQPVTTDGWDTVFQAIQNAGIPLVLVAYRVNTNENLWDTELIYNETEMGRKCGQWLVNNIGTSADIVEIQGVAGITVTTERNAGFASVIDNYAGLTILDSGNGNFDKNTGKTVMESFLSAHGADIDVVYSHSDTMALGAVEAIDEYSGPGSPLVPGSDIKVISINAEGTALQAVVDGKLNCTAENSPLWGPSFFEIVEDISGGESVEKTVYREIVLYDSSNTTQAMVDSRGY